METAGSAGESQEVRLWVETLWRWLSAGKLSDRIQSMGCGHLETRCQCGMSRDITRGDLQSLAPGKELKSELTRSLVELKHRLYDWDDACPTAVARLQAVPTQGPSLGLPRRPEPCLPCRCPSWGVPVACSPALGP
ncbi:unnamed protein product [Boreogadus saida]